jgi:nicotinamidase-related amidase
MKSALLVVDVQKSFTARPYWSEEDVPAFLSPLQQLINRSQSAGVPVLQVFHVDGPDEPSNPFSRRSGLIEALPQLSIKPAEVFSKSVHSAMFASTADGQTMDHWLRKRGIGRLIVTGIRTEQCCETTTRHAFDLGYDVTYAIDATLTFKMVSRSGRTFTPAEIRERTELVLAGRFAEVCTASAVTL